MAGDGPDFWRVHGVAAGDRLVVHKEAHAQSAVIGELAPGTSGIRNLGCRGLPSFSEWQRMTPPERERRARARWCRIEWNGSKGWVAGRFLVEAPAPKHAADRSAFVRAWEIYCRTSGCTIEQKGVGANDVTTLVIEPVSSNARISIVHRRLPRSGTLAFYTDGEQISAGPMAQLTRSAKDRGVLEPDDITAGLLKRLRRHKNLVISFAGEERGAEFHVEGFDEAMAEYERLKAGSR
jgi:invasion protein IalB